MVLSWALCIILVIQALMRLRQRDPHGYEANLNDTELQVVEWDPV